MTDDTIEPCRILSLEGPVAVEVEFVERKETKGRGVQCSGTVVEDFLARGGPRLRDANVRYHAPRHAVSLNPRLSRNSLALARTIEAVAVALYTTN